ncbi:hypothetical protein BVG19_g1092 [[Candida] boidinii]|nr:hypothetical protein BVG19_g1092 [[Candida] boidinii]OWB50110.1 hypothetical protein B5S27_g1657 [[Candida] boidinii]
MAATAVHVPVSDYPVPLSENGLAVEYLTGNHSHDIPTETYDNEVKALLKKLESKPGFDKNLKFDPKKHIIFKEEDFDKVKTFTLQDLKIEKTHCKTHSDFGATFPFPLINQEACDMLVYEALQPKIMDKWGRLPNLAKDSTGLDFHVGGHINAAPFTKGLWHSPEIRKIFERFYGVPVAPIYDSEIAHFNVSLASLDAKEEKSIDELKEELKKQTEEQNETGGDQIPSVLGLHYDSVGFVCVIMVDCGDGEEMIGGETGIITGDEKVVRVPDPKVGHCTLLQGRVIRHVATKPLNNSNRITSVGGFYPSDPDVLDNSALTSTKPSVLPRALNDQFYPDWFDHRFRKMEAYMKSYREKLVDNLNKGGAFDQEEAVKKCKELEDYLRKSWYELEAVSNNPYPAKHFQIPYSDLPDYE